MLMRQRLRRISALCAVCLALTFMVPATFAAGEDIGTDGYTEDGTGGDTGNDTGGYTEEYLGTEGETEPAETPSPSPTPAVTATPAASKRGTASVVKATESTAGDGTNYVTFAVLDTQGNTIAVTLFYGGIGCIVLGAVGVLGLFFRFLRNRRYNRHTGAHDIFQEIEKAEVRNDPEPMELSGGQEEAAPMRAAPSRGEAPAARGTAPVLSAEQARRRAVIPVEVSLYTEEFSMSEMQAASAKPTSSQRPQSSQRPVPSQRPISSQPPVPSQRPSPSRQPVASQRPAASQRPEPSQRPTPRAKGGADSAREPRTGGSSPEQSEGNGTPYNTEEILREALQDREKL